MEECSGYEKPNGNIPLIVGLVLLMLGLGAFFYYVVQAVNEDPTLLNFSD